MAPQKSSPRGTRSFAPLAMLPAWYATDEKLVVQDWNDFAADLLVFFYKNYLLEEHYLSIEIDPPTQNGYESLWRCILDCSGETLHLVGDALRIVSEHRRILDQFNEGKGCTGIDDLVRDLASVTGTSGVSGFAYRPSTRDYRQSELVLGVKVSPAQGLPLKSRVEIGGTVVEYLDMVMAYQIEPIKNGEDLIGLQFMGLQPALHDATNRHEIWVLAEERIRIEKEAQVTQFLSHAFNTPLYNIASRIKELEDAGLEGYYRTVQQKLDSNFDDLRNLCNLFLFVASAQGTVPSHLAASRGSQLSFQNIEPAEILEGVCKAVESVLNGRTREPRDAEKLKTIQGLHALDGVCEKCDPSVVAANILNLGELSQTPRLYIVLDFEAKLGLEHSVADNVKTAFLNLIVTELLINAIKFADANSPQVTISFEITPTRDYLKIHFVNNGLELKENEFEDVLGTVAMKPGEKRTALGLELNKRAAGILSWELQWIAPAVPGTHLELSIPYRD